MIYVGYPCVGKSSISGKNKNIDLESSNFFYHNKELNSVVRDNHSWIEIYVNIVEDLNKQGFNVFCSSHLGVVTELKKRNIQFCGIFPSEHLKDFWIKRAENRYNSNPSDKNKKADQPIDVIAFNRKDKLPIIKDNKPFDILYHVEENVWNNMVNIQLNVKDVRGGEDDEDVMMNPCDDDPNDYPEVMTDLK